MVLSKFEVIVLAGGDERINNERKTVVEVGGKPVLQHVIDTFYSIGKYEITVVCHEDDEKRLRLEKDTRVLKDKGSLLENIVQAGDEKEPPFLIVTGDMPFLTKESIYDFTDRCKLYDGDIFAGVVPGDYLQPFSQYHNKKFWLQSEFSCLTANMAVINSKEINTEIVDKYYAVRRQRDKKENINFIKFLAKCVIKYPKQTLLTTSLYISTELARINTSELAEKSYSPLVKKLITFAKEKNIEGYLRKFATQKRIENYGSKLFRCRGKLIVSPYAELALDLDFEKDYRQFSENYNQITKLIKEGHSKIKSYLS